METLCFRVRNICFLSTWTWIAFPDRPTYTDTPTPASAALKYLAHPHHLEDPVRSSVATIYLLTYLFLFLFFYSLPNFIFLFYPLLHILRNLRACVCFSYAINNRSESLFRISLVPYRPRICGGTRGSFFLPELVPFSCCKYSVLFLISSIGSRPGLVAVACCLLPVFEFLFCFSMIPCLSHSYLLALPIRIG